MKMAAAQAQDASDSSDDEETDQVEFAPLFADALPFGTFSFRDPGGARKAVTCHALESQEEEERRKLQAAEVWRGGVVAARWLGEGAGGL